MALIFAEDVFLISLFFVSVLSSQQCPDLLGTSSWRTAPIVPQLSLDGAEAGILFYKIHSYMTEKMLCGFILFVFFYFPMRKK